MASAAPSSSLVSEGGDLLFPVDAGGGGAAAAAALSAALSAFSAAAAAAAAFLLAFSASGDIDLIKSAAAAAATRGGRGDNAEDEAAADPGGPGGPVSITLSPHNFQVSQPKKVMASLDDLEVQRVRPFERLCFIVYVVLYMVFVFMALSFIKLLTMP